jgi:NTP pyrophosphatase (non-canonical NTP hydrolase)
MPEEVLISATNFRMASIDEWANEFWEVYGPNDIKRSLADVWLMAVEDSSRVGEALRRQEYETGLRSLCHSFVWVLSFCNKLAKDPDIPPQFRSPAFRTVSDIVWEFYPQSCKTCTERACYCFTRREKLSAEEREKRLAKARQEEVRPFALDDWMGMLGHIYDMPNSTKSLEEVGFHYLEEIGEVARATRRLDEYPPPTGRRIDAELRARQRNLVEEIADSISWTSAVLRRMANIAANFGFLFRRPARRTAGSHSGLEGRLRLPTLLWTEYKGEELGHIACATCARRPCGCGVSESALGLREATPGE